MTNLISNRSDLTPLAINAAGLRTFPFDEDTMEPTLRSGDAVLAEPADRFKGDGLYILMFGEKVSIWRCSDDYSGGIDLTRDNRLSPGIGRLSREKFDDHVLGRVIVICHRVALEKIDA